MPPPLALIVGSIVLWILNATLYPTGIAKVGPLLIFMLIPGVFGAISMVRAIKCLTRKIYYKSVLSFVFFGLLVACFFIDFVVLVSA